MLSKKKKKGLIFHFSSTFSKSKEMLSSPQHIELCKHASVDSIKCLVEEKKFDINKYSETSGFTPLLWSLYYGNLPVAHFLIENGANVQSCTLSKATALHFASKLFAASSVVEILLERGADVNAKDIEGCTPLFRACEKMFCDVKTIQLLIDYGADPSITNKEGQPTFDLTGASFGEVKLILESVPFLTKRAQQKD
jgi:ankyrin repeat protein